MAWASLKMSKSNAFFDSSWNRGQQSLALAHLIDNVVALE